MAIPREATAWDLSRAADAATVSVRAAAARWCQWASPLWHLVPAVGNTQDPPGIGTYARSVALSHLGDHVVE